MLSSLILAFSTQLPAQPPPELLVAAASDLAPILSPHTEVAGFRIRYSFGASGQLARQVVNGAPFEVFLSANEAFAAQVIAAGKAVAADRRHYATGQLALWSKSGTVTRLEDLPKPAVQRLTLANPKTAPYGAAAQQALAAAGLWEPLQPKIVIAESVRQTLQFAESGNVDACLTSWTLVHDKGGHLVPASLYRPIIQVGVPVNGSAAGRRFLEWLTGPEGRRILRAGGLDTP